MLTDVSSSSIAIGSKSAFCGGNDVGVVGTDVSCPALPFMGVWCITGVALKPAACTSLASMLQTIYLVVPETVKAPVLVLHSLAAPASGKASLDQD